MIFNNNPTLLYKNATTPKELRNVISLRHKRLVDYEGTIGPEMTHDYFDGIGYNFIGFINGDPEKPENVLGTLRVVDEKDLEHLNGGNGGLKIKNFDIEPYAGENNLFIGRLVTDPEKPKKIKVQPGLFGCVYVYGHDYGSTDLFIIANCEIPSGSANNPKIPKSYRSLGFKPIGEMKRKYYDDFNAFSVPMHADRETLIGKSRLTPRRLIFETFRNKINFEEIPIEQRKQIYKETIDMLPESRLSSFEKKGRSDTSLDGYSELLYQSL